MEQFLEAGRIVNTFGIRGEVKLECWCDGAAFMKKLKRVFINGTEYGLVSAREHKGMVLLTLRGVEDVNAAMVLKNKVVTFDRADVRLPRGRFFLQDIIGATVLDEDGTEVGKLTEVLEMPAQNVYIVQGESEHSIPDVPEFIREVDVKNKILRVKLIEGM